MTMAMFGEAVVFGSVGWSGKMGNSIGSEKRFQRDIFATIISVKSDNMSFKKKKILPKL